MINTTKKLRCIFPAIFLFLFTESIAQGDLLIYPKRISFDDSKKTQQISLSNSGKDTARYTISVIEIRMKEDGSFETISEPDSGQHFAGQYFRFFPRNVVLGPNESQTIKIQLINTSEMQPGEYRSHIYFRAEAETKPLGEEQPNQDASISVRLVPVFGISIPVIIRKGESTTLVRFSNASLQFEKDTIPVLEMDVTRTGNMSVYGDILVDYTSEQGKTTRVAMAKGLAVYTPNTRRHFRLLPDKTTGINYHRGSLRMTFIDQSVKATELTSEEIFLR